MPRRVPDDLDAGIFHPGQPQQFLLRVARNRGAHAATRCRQGHFHKHLFVLIRQIFQAHVVHQAEIHNIHRNLRVITGPQRFPDHFLVGQLPARKRLPDLLVGLQSERVRILGIDPKKPTQSMHGVGTAQRLGDVHLGAGRQADDVANGNLHAVAIAGKCHGLDRIHGRHRTLGTVRGQCANGRMHAPRTAPRGLTGKNRFPMYRLRVTIELINTGSELLLGRVLNTHLQWLGRQLANRGYTVSRQIAVPDGGRDIQDAVRDALGRADCIITTGGLGPTSDDLTRELIAQLLGRPLHHDPAVELAIRHFFESRGRRVPERTKVEAMVPDGARVLPNRHGTAPGLALVIEPNPFRADQKRCVLVMLPGPPRELRPMFTTDVVPVLQEFFPPSEPFVCRTLRTTGLGESYVEERIAPPLAPLVAAGMDLGYCARVGEVEVRFVARGAEASATVAAAEAITRAAIGEYIFGEEDDTLEGAVLAHFQKHHLTLALAESCTGGHVANRMTNIPGASAVLLAGYVTYANSAKIQTLGVQPETLAQHGAVSEATAREMAEGARQASGADWAVAITGIAGPDGGTPDKPLGTVFIAWAGPQGTTASRQLNPFDRETFKFTTAQQALHGLLTAARDLPRHP